MPSTWMNPENSILSKRSSHQNHILCDFVHRRMCRVWAWWVTPVIPVLARWGQGGREFRTSLSNITSFETSLSYVKPYLKNTPTSKRKVFRGGTSLDRRAEARREGRLRDKSQRRQVSV